MGLDIGNVKKAGDGIATGVGDGEDFAPGVIGYTGLPHCCWYRGSQSRRPGGSCGKRTDPVVTDGADASISIVVIVQMVGSVVPGLVYQIARSVTVENGISPRILPCAQARFIVTILYHGRAVFQGGRFWPLFQVILVISVPQFSGFPMAS